MTLGNLLLIIFAASLSAVAQVALKMGVSRVPENSSVDLFSALLGMAFTPLVLVGVALYGLSLAAWLFVLRKTDLSLAYPFVGISFVLVFIMSAFLLGESIGLTRIAGSALIFAGIVLLVL